MPVQLLMAASSSSAYRHNTTISASFFASSLWVCVSLDLGPTQMIQDDPDLFPNKVTFAGSGN